MFKKLSIVGLAGVLVVVGGGLAAALAGNTITTAETLVLTETNLKGRGIDVGKPGFGPGDSFIFVNSLDRSNGRVKGRHRARAVHDPDRGMADMPGGRIHRRSGRDLRQRCRSEQRPAGRPGLRHHRWHRGVRECPWTVHVEPTSDTEDELTLTLIP